nr:GAF domain-containing protein [Candidatus Delongbacteria bacterium]
MKTIELLSEISLTFIKLDDFDNQMNTVLKIIGKHLDVSRVYVFTDNESGTAAGTVYEWCNTGIKPQINQLLNGLYPIIPSWKRILEKEGRIYSEKINELPSVLFDILAPRNILSIIVYPLIVEYKMTGFIGLECVQSRKWTDIELEMLKTVSGIISSSMERDLLQKRLRQSENNFRSFFNTIDDLFIVVNMDGD